MSTYDDYISKAETIVKELESAPALSMDEYKQKSKEVKQLLNLCEQQLKELGKDLLV